MYLHLIFIFGNYLKNKYILLLYDIWKPGLSKAHCGTDRRDEEFKANEYG